MDLTDYYKKAAKEMNYVNNWIATTTANMMKKKLSDVYETLIDEFYSRPPKFYRRHDVGKGKPIGMNLYRALEEGSYDYNRIRPEKGVIDGSIKIDPADMEEYNYRQSKEEVLNYILNGYRFYMNGISEERIMRFTTIYEDDEVSAKGTILQILLSVRDQLGNKYAIKAKERAKKELKLKYIEIE